MNPIELNALVNKACHSKKPEDYLQVLENLYGVNLYFSVSNGNSQEILLSKAEGRTVLPLFVSKDDERLSSNFGTILWEHALKLVLEMEKAEAIVIRPASEYWLAVPKESVQALLNVVTEPSVDANEGDVNALIALAASTRSDDDYQNAFEHMYGRTLFYPVKDDEQVKIKEIDKGLRALPLFVNENDEQLGETYSSLDWNENIALFLEKTGVDGVILHTDKNDEIMPVAKEDIYAIAVYYAKKYA